MISLHWNYKDVFRACRLALSAKKIWMQMVGLFVGGVGYALLTYLAYWSARIDLAVVWQQFTLIPFLDPAFARDQMIPWWSWAIWVLGLIWLVLSCMVAGAAVSKVTIEQLRGDDFYEMREAYRHARARLGAIVGAPLMPILFAAFLVVCGLILSLLGAIPEAGPIIVGIFAVPAFGVSLFIVYLLVVFLVALMLVPAIVGSTKNDTFDTLFEVFSCTNEQTWRFVWYSLLLKVLAIACAVILGAFSVIALRVGSGVLGAFMGTNLASILSGGPYYLHLAVPTWCPLYDAIGNSGLLFGSQETMSAVTIGQNVGALFVGLAAYVVILMILGYASAIWNVGQTLIFSILLRKKDDRNLLTEKDTEELLSEPVPECPPATASSPTPEPDKKEPRADA